MNLNLTVKLAMVLVALSLVAYGLSSILNPMLGLGTTSILNEAWKLIALSLGIAILAGILQPSIRGVKRGDKVFAIVQRHGHQNGQTFFFPDTVPATALEDGKVGGRIRVSLPNGAGGEGVIVGYGGALTPPTIKLVESERLES